MEFLSAVDEGWVSQSLIIVWHILPSGNTKRFSPPIKFDRYIRTTMAIPCFYNIIEKGRAICPLIIISISVIGIFIYMFMVTFQIVPTAHDEHERVDYLDF